MKCGQNVPWLSMRYALSCGEDRQIFNLPSSKYIFSATNRNIEKASHTFVVYPLLIDILQFVWSCVQPVIQ